MKKRFQSILQEQQLLDANKKVLLAVSGGVDSIVLFDLMQSIPQADRPQVHIAHINHQLRSEANQEEQFVRELAHEAQIPFYTYRWQKKDHPTSGIEEAARIKRYAFFKEIMNTYAIDYLMTGHHLDDHVETVLMRLTRGASLEQLLGIQLHQYISLDQRDGHLIRPLLHFSKEELYEFADAKKLVFVEDESNLELDFTRNRFRNEIIPLLKEENERFNEHVDQFTSDLADRIEIAEAPIQEAFEKTVHVDKKTIQLNLKTFYAFSKAMQRLVITKIFEKLYHGEANRYKANYVDLVNHWLSEGEVNTSLDLTGDYIVEKTYNRAIFMKKILQEESIPSKKELNELTIDRLNEWIELSETEAIGLFTKEDEAADDELLIDHRHLHLPLRIRHRQPGDRMTYKGLKGSKKVSDIFIDDKTPPTAREKAWIVEDNTDSILWLIGHRKMHLFTETETDKMLYSLKYVKN